MQGVTKTALQMYSKHYCLASITKTFILKGIQTIFIQRLERWIIFTPLSVKTFVTLATQQHLEYHWKSLFEIPCAEDETFHTLLSDINIRVKLLIHVRYVETCCTVERAAYKHVGH
jgi:hypothetical protein